MDKVTDFPQYRKLSNGKVFYCIHNDRLFEELQIIGSKVKRYRFEVSQYPEILRIQEMLNLQLPGIEMSNAAEFNSFSED